MMVDSNYVVLVSNTYLEVVIYKTKPNKQNTTTKIKNNNRKAPQTCFIFSNIFF